MKTVRKGAKPEVIGGDRRRRDLLVAAYEVIAEKGLEGLRTRAIAARAGVNISTLYYYFGTKEALLEAVVTFIAEKFAGGEMGQMRPPATLREYFARGQETSQSNPELTVVIQELALRALRDPATRAALRPVFKFWNYQVEAVIRAEIAAETMPRAAQPHVEELALVITSFSMGAMMQRGVNPKAVELDALARQLTRLLSGAMH
jgi:AcrR family transcriptional regulator